MARKLFKPRTHETGITITTKTFFGSTSDMVVNVENYTFEDSSVNVGESQVICKDDRGFYITENSRIDSGIADPNRYANQKNRVHLKEKSSST